MSLSMSIVGTRGIKDTVEDDVCWWLTAECWNIEAPTWTHVLQTPCLAPPALLQTLKQPISSAVLTYCTWLRNMCWAVSPTDLNSCEFSWNLFCTKAFRVTFLSDPVWSWRFAVTLTATLFDFTWIIGQRNWVVWYFENIEVTLWTTVT